MRAAHFNKVSSCPVIIIARLITVKYLLGNDAKNSRNRRWKKLEDITTRSTRFKSSEGIQNKNHSVTDIYIFSHQFLLIPIKWNQPPQTSPLLFDSPHLSAPDHSSQKWGRNIREQWLRSEPQYK